MAASVEVRDLSFRYSEEGFRLTVPALELPRGERVAFTGPSGCGKTTFLHLLSGILTCDAGRLSVLGRELAALRDAERRRFRIRNVGIIFQEFELLEHLTVRENVLLPYFLNPVLTLDDETQASLERVAASLGIGDLLRRRPRRLSHGERQRAAIARALVTGPELILGDEPTGNLDPDNTRLMLELVSREVTDRGATFVMVTHDHSLLSGFDRVVDFPEIAGGAA